MTIDVDRKSNDLQVVWVPPVSDTDARVPTAEEMDYAEDLTLATIRASRAQVRPAGVQNRPVFTAGGSRSINIPQGLQFYSHNHPSLTQTPAVHTLTLPALVDSATTISRYDYIYLLCFSCLVTSEIDSDISLTFTWRDQSSSIQTVTKENTQRVRSFYAFVWNIGEIDIATLLSRFTLTDGDRQLTPSASNAGVALGASRLYTLDSNMVSGETYTLIDDSLELIDLLRVWRVQETNQNGYVWGNSGESDFLNDYHLQPTYQYVGPGWDDWTNRLRESFWRLLKGQSLSNTPTKDRSVQNLVNGQVGTNDDAPGIATASPNGSTALANGQRIIFSNQAVTQTVFAIRVTTTNSSGNAVATVNFAGNSPAGSKFSATASDHSVFASDGTDISDDGNFTGLDGTGALTWTEQSSSVIAPGDIAYLVAAIEYPAGSGFPVAGKIEAVYLGAVQLDSANVRETDLTAYVAPANSETHIAILNPGNAGLRWIYKKFTVTSSGSGVVAIPATARGLIAWISGTSAPTTRQDKAVITGLENSTSYDILCYHAPPGEEQWQFQFKVPRYAGTDERLFVNGSRVDTHPLAIAHSQGGGNSSFIADGDIQFTPVSFRLPSNSAAGATKDYTMDTAIQHAGDAAAGNITFKESTYLGGGNGLVGLRPGAILTATNGSEAQSQSQEVVLEIDGLPAGVAKPPLSSESDYQLALAMDIEKGEDHRMLVVTLNESPPGTTTIYAPLGTDSPDYAAIDTFRYY